MGIFDSIFDPGKASRSAMKEYQKGWDQTKKYEEPFWQAGMDQTGNLNDAIKSLMDPEKLQSDWASGYQESPYAKYLQESAQNKGLEAAGSMGLMGSSSALQNIQQGASNIMQSDRDKYMDDLMKKYLSGISTSQGMFNTGSQMGGQLGNQSMNFGEQMGAGKYKEQNAPMDMMMNMLKLYMASKDGGIK